MTRIWICFLLLSFAAQAHVQRLSPSEGLSQSYVSEMLIDKHGYLWLATENGVDRFDGYQIENLQGADGELSAVLIDDLYQDSSSNIWIAPMAAGLTKYNPDKRRFKRYLIQDQSSSADFEHAIFSMLTVNDSLWLGRGGNIARFDEQSDTTETLFEYAEPTEQHITRAILQRDNRVYIGTSKGLFSLDENGKHAKTHTLPSDESSGKGASNVRALVDTGSELLIGTERGLFALSHHAEPAQSIRTIVADIHVWQIHLVNQHLVLLATEQGLLQLDLQSEKVTARGQLALSRFAVTNPAVISLQPTEQGDIWVGTKNDGAFLLSQSRFSFTNLNNDTLKGDKLSHYNVWSSTLVENELVLGTSNGLTFVDLDTFESRVVAKHDLSKSGVEPFTVHELFKYRDELILSTLDGLFRYSPATGEVSQYIVNQSELQPLVENILFGPTLGNDGYLYFVNKFQGFFRVNLESADIEQLQGDFANINPMQAQAFVTSSTGAHSELFLFADEQLYLVEPNTLSLTSVYQLPKQYESMEVHLNGLAHDHQGRLWLSFANIGIFALDGQSYELVASLPKSSADTQNLFYDLILDNHNDLWMSSHKGIWRLDTDTLHMQQFTHEDGLQTNEYNMGSVQRLSDGRLAFGSIKGVSILDPDSFTQQQAIVEQVNITSAELSYRTFEPTELGPVSVINLAYDDVGLALRFSAMQFNYQDRIVYEYQFDDSQRTINQSHNRLVFSRLSPGSHTLKVWAKDPFTGQLSPPTQLQINVAYPIWRHPWALVVYVLVIGAIIAFWLHRKRKTQRLIIKAYDETAQSEARLKLALQGSHSGVWDWQKQSHKIYQPRLKSELGYDFEHCTFDQFLALIHPQQRQQYRIAWLAFLSTDKGYFESVYRLQDNHGQWRWYKDVGQVMQWHEGMPIRVAGTYTNMTREMLFAQRARMFGAAFEQSSDWLVILDHKLRIKAVNQALKQHAHYRVDAKSSRHLTFGLSRSARMNYLRILTNLEVGEHYQTRERVIDKAGNVLPVILKLSKVIDAEDKLTNFVVSLTDISSAQAVLDVSEQQAQYDAQTGLAMRHVFIDRVSHAIEVAQRENTGCALLLVQVSKHNNPATAPASVANDDVFPLLAKRLGNLLRAADSVGLIQENMFAVLIEPLHDVDHCVTVSRKIRDGLLAPLPPPYEGSDIVVSLGVATYPQDATEALELSQCAAMAVYKATKLRSNQCQFYADELNDYVHQALKVEQEVKAAHQNADFINLYQKIADEHGQCQGVEVLLRWQKSTHEQVMPKHFIGAIRSTDLWYKLFLQTLQRTLFERQAWATQSACAKLHINICGREFFAANAVGEVNALLAHSKMEPQQLVLEIQLSHWLKLDSIATQKLLAISEQGIQLALQVDDFAALASYSLINSPFTQLKFDTQVTQLLCGDAALAQLARNYITGYRAVGINVVAVGVEIREQFESLCALGVNGFQGNYIEQPQRGECL